MEKSEVVKLAQALIQRPSITPQDAGCQLLLRARLEAVGFTVEELHFGDTSNFWAWHGRGSPCLTLLGHTDVVPPGPLSAWDHPPFASQIHQGKLYGRGAADMKGALAAMVIAAEQFVIHHPEHLGRLSLLVTSDEEGTGDNGTKRVVEWLQQQGESIDYCIVGEPSSEHRVADTVKVGRRGSLTAQITFHGRQGHVAYPQLADNPIHRVIPALQTLLATEWDQPTEDFPATSLQLTRLMADSGATNVIPGQLHATLNWRYTPALTVAQIQQRLLTLWEPYQLSYTIDWRHSAAPFFTSNGVFRQRVLQVVKECTGVVPTLSTSGGTSDGRFIAAMGAEVVEIGLSNATIHQVNESIALEALPLLTQLYQQLLVALLGANG
ncbi:MAG: succinyl-diaminopimelate desuccinylase [Candidatus Symbiodolus clandestinus]